MTINSVCVCGAGTMGSGIAQVAAQAGFTTILYEVSGEVLQRARLSIEKNLGSMIDKGKIMTDDREKILQRIRFTSEIETCTAEFFIEAIVEKAGAKIDLFNQLARINPAESIFASNTSSLSIAAIAEGLKNPGRVIGLHFFNPAPLMKLVEVVTSKMTEATVTEIVLQLAHRMNKVAVVCKDSPGFIVNRVARPYYIEALRLVEEGKISLEKIDELMEATGFRMGPFKLMDLIGNDVNYAVSGSVYEQLGRPERLRPSVIQKEKIDKGELGRKTGRGYYKY